MISSGIGSIASYDNLEQVGEGTYGYVYRARDKKTGDTVALKRLIIHKENSGTLMTNGTTHHYDH